MAVCSQARNSRLQWNGIQQIRTAPYHPASNGQAERTVQTFKTTMNKMLNQKGTINQKVQRFLMAYHTTSHSATNCTPAELLFGRRLRTALDIIKPSFSKKKRRKIVMAWFVEHRIEEWGNSVMDRKFLYITLVLVLDRFQGW